MDPLGNKSIEEVIGRHHIQSISDDEKFRLKAKPIIDSFHEQVSDESIDRWIAETLDSDSPSPSSPDSIILPGFKVEIKPPKPVKLMDFEFTKLRSYIYSRESDFRRVFNEKLVARMDALGCPVTKPEALRGPEVFVRSKEDYAARIGIVLLAVALVALSSFAAFGITGETLFLVIMPMLAVTAGIIATMASEVIEFRNPKRTYILMRCYSPDRNRLRYAIDNGKSMGKDAYVELGEPGKSALSEELEGYDQELDGQELDGQELDDMMNLVDEAEEELAGNQRGAEQRAYLKIRK